MSAVLIAVAAAGAKADSIGGVNFGTAGPSEWGVLALGGSGATGFGSSGTSVQFAGAPPYGGIIGSPGNLGIAGTGSLQASSVTIDGIYYKGSSTGTDNISSTSINGGTNSSAAANTLLSTAATDAANGLAAAQSLFSHGCTAGIGGVACGGSLSNSVTITPGNPNGQNVLILSSMNLSNNAVITLGGTANTQWVIEDEGDLTTSHSSIIAQNGNMSSVLVVVNGSEHTNGGLNQESILDGVYVVPTGTAQNSPGLIDGELIAGGNQVTFVSGASVTTPELPTAMELSFDMLGLALFVGLIRLKQHRNA